MTRYAMTRYAMTIRRSSPSGQAMVELLILTASFVAILMGTSLLYRQVREVQLSHSQARFDLDRCRLSSGRCQDWQVERGQLDNTDWTQQPILSRGGEAAKSGGPKVQRSHDEPRADVSGQSSKPGLLSGLRGFTAKLGHELFELPPQDNLLRVQAQVDQSDRYGVRKSMSRLALVSEDWSSARLAMAQARVQAGAEPSDILETTSRLAYSPITRVLMPTFETLTLEEGSTPFSQGFHRMDWMRPFPGTTRP